MRQYGLGLEASTPLWYYTMREASVLNGGVRLGPVGGRIVAETIIGLLQLDRFAYLNLHPRFRPSLPSQTPDTFTMTDLLRWARVDPAAAASSQVRACSDRSHSAVHERVGDERAGW